MSVLLKILEWSKMLPDWQSDALRRFFESNAPLSDQDEKDLLLMLKKEHGIEDPAELAPNPVLLSETHLDGEDQDDQTVLLTKLHGVRNVNKLKGEEEIDFAESGLTLIYGGNASGKSGYSRILKKACRARDAGGRILGNIYFTPTIFPAEAIFEIKVNGSNQTEKWIDNGEKVAHLSRIAVFDSKCARLLVNEKNEIDYVPYGLDTLTRLGSLQGKLALKIREEDTPAPKLSVDLISLQPNTAVKKLLDSISPSTDLSEIENLATLNKEEEKKMDELKVHLHRRKQDDSTVIAANYRRKIIRTEDLVTHIKQTQTLLGDENLRLIKSDFEFSQELSEATRLLSIQSFSSEPLQGVGSETWKTMFEAAREYSEKVAYLDKDFPVVDKDGKCVLCQQELTLEATDRLKRFDGFIKNKTAEQAETQANKLAGVIQSINNRPLAQ